MRKKRTSFLYIVFVECLQSSLLHCALLDFAYYQHKKIRNVDYPNACQRKHNALVPQFRTAWSAWNRNKPVEFSLSCVC